jgi:hypothetical protein
LKVGDNYYGSMTMIWNVWKEVQANDRPHIQHQPSITFNVMPPCELLANSWKEKSETACADDSICGCGRLFPLKNDPALLCDARPSPGNYYYGSMRIIWNDWKGK